ncbi:DNA-directed RNA polymerase III subunit rpc4-like [Malania oleifera]|uniref:DNA-directed RNA polymerase III subunit rpc4-like n=1 Tax=Malania oleifera TaxID=397392 RepID=UPI0025AE0EAE|nr:DNA-directed RNA polymerase III subunit rpc4-like [Malania oleifera]XP_057952252.1 DNA-directed RNA polymerase III subunit rpc4-like [Malania oleifera]
MAQDMPSSSPRKFKFTPKAPPPRKAKPPVPKTERGVDDEEAAETQILLRRFNEDLRRQRPKVEKNSSVQVAFGPGATPSTSIRTYGISQDGISAKSSQSGLEDSSDNEQAFFSLPSTAKLEALVSSSDAANDPAQMKKEYREPWDYNRIYYPTTLPLRRPYSGDPEKLDKAEFGEAGTGLEYDENTLNPAVELGLLEETEKGRMIFLQLPPNLPLIKRSASAAGKEKVDSSISTGSVFASAGEMGKEIAGSSTLLRGTGVSGKGCKLEELSGGYLGKMLVYKSGAVKLKLGGVLYDVSPGSDCIFAQDVVAINTNEKHCCCLGDLDKRAVITPDVDFLLNDVINLG